MWPTKHSFEKCNRKDKSPFSQKRHDGPILPHLTHLPNYARYFIGSRYISWWLRNYRKTTGRNSRVYRTMLDIIYGTITCIHRAQDKGVRSQ